MRARRRQDAGVAHESGTPHFRASPGGGPHQDPCPDIGGGAGAVVGKTRGDPEASDRCLGARLEPTVMHTHTCMNTGRQTGRHT
eukprot:2327735-Pyramimonas_sp.AAC.1